jgi:RluA family pseudouridine synthase
MPPKAFDIIFNDSAILVINKLVKIVVQPTPKKEKNTLNSLVNKEFQQKIYPCHRLDKETTGLMIYAKDKKSQARIMEQFKSREIKKKYYAFIRGAPKKDKEVMVDKFVSGKRGLRKKKKIAQAGYKVLKKYLKFSFIVLQPKTGRKNQLRIQLANRGYPILGESKFAYRRDFDLNFKRLALHAFFISFKHPSTQEKVTFKVGLADDMKRFLEKNSSKGGAK